MDEDDFEGTLVLEALARIGGVEAFFDAIDLGDLGKAASLMRRAQVDEGTLGVVMKKIAAGDTDH